MNLRAAGAVTSAAAEAAREKAYSAERTIAGIRPAVVAFSTFVFFALDNQPMSAGLAYGVLVIGWLYMLSVWLLKPYKRFPAILWSYFSTLTDAVLVAAWVLATGGALSPYHVRDR